MKIIVGLGNPGKNYENTRHNLGFMTINALAQDLCALTQNELNFVANKNYSSEILELNLKGEKIILLKPQTYMNATGQAIKKIADFYKVNPKDIWIITDDLELPLGKIRIRLSGSSGGHKGVESIIEGFDTKEFTRIKIGIGEIKTLNAHKEIPHFSHRPHLDAKEYVLEKFSQREMPIVEKAIEKVSQIILESLNRCDYLKAHTIDIN